MEDRSSSQISQNPFAALFPSVEKAEEFRKQHEDSLTTAKTVDKHRPDTVMQSQPITVSLKDVQDNNATNESEHGDPEALNDEKDKVWMVNDLLQRVFLITVDNGK